MSQNASAVIHSKDEYNQVTIQEEGSSAALYAIAMLIPIYVGRLTEFQPFISLGIGKIAVFIAVLIYVISSKSEAQRLASFWPLSQMRYVVYFFLLSIISIPFSTWPGLSVDVTIGFGKVLVFAFLLVLSVRRKKDLEFLSWTLILTVFGLVFISFISPRYVEGNRVTVALAYDPNDFALLIVMTIALAYYYMRKMHGAKKVLLVLILVALSFALMRTASRGGLLSFAVVVIAILIKQGWRSAFLKLPVFAVLTLVVMMVAGEQYYARFATLLHVGDDYNVSEKIGRVEVWKRGVEIVLENPLVGVGPGNFSVAEGRKHEGGKWSVSHNSFLQVGGELGIPGLIMFVLIIVRSVSLSRNNQDKDTKWLSNGLEVGFYAFCVGGFFLSWAYSYIFYFFIALAAANAKLSNLQEEIKSS
jgi:O-antigen ligase